MELLKMIKKALLIVTLLIFSSCIQVDCNANASAFREIECLQIFEKLPTLESYRLKSEGKHLITGKDCVCDDGTRALGNYADILEKGDTIIKRKGELTFSIHKKDTVIVVKWECEGKVYE